MGSFVRRHIVSISLVSIAIVVGSIFFGTRDTTPTWTTDTVTKGTVSQIISISGTVDAVSTAELAFTTGGILESIQVHEGDTVAQGQTLAVLTHNDLKADYQDAEAALLIAEANLNELISGMRPEERDVSKTTLEIAQKELERITNEQNDLVKNAYRTLLSTDLEAQPLNKNVHATPPRITGTYTCTEGTYTLSVYRSSSQSGYSYRLTGIEEGTYTAYTDTDAPLGACGLSIQFIEGESYGNSTWSITIPNTESTAYVQNRNSYTLALTKKENAIHEAEQNLELAEKNHTLDIALPRDEAKSREEAKVLQARARLAVIQAQIQDHTMIAPFDGVITKIDPVVGETVTTAPIITLVSKEAFALTALIPEIDITKIHIGQKADIEFDARQGETLSGTTIFISPLAEEIDGVSYFEAKLTLDTPVDWLRSGLNADIDIIVDRHENVIRIPKRYLIEKDGTYSVQIPEGTTAILKPVSVGFMGNDGFVEVQGLSPNTTIIAP